MKNINSYLRVLALLVIAVTITELTVETNNGQSVFKEYPVSILIIGIAVLFAVAIEICVAALKNVLYRSLTEEQKLKFQGEQKEQFTWFKRTYAKLTDSKPIEKEAEIVLDHNYDGIRELDNNLPPWWVYGFYLTIIFAIVYLVRFEVMKDYNQDEEYQAEVAAAKIAIEEYKKNAKDLIDANSVELLTDPSDLSKGQAIFSTNCIACHRADGGGGIGPNLTDDYWILGGGIKNVFHTISEGGRDGKGMVAWKSSLKPIEIAQVASYVISLRGTNPEGAKEPQGDIWKPEE